MKAQIKKTIVVPQGWAKIQDIKKGDFFKRKEDSKMVLVKDAYNREIKKYEAHDFEDISDFKNFKKDTLVFIDFEF